MNNKNKVKLNSSNKFLLLILFFLFSLLIGTILSKQGFHDFFMFDQLGQIKHLLENHQMDFTERYCPGYDICLYLIHVICGVPLEAVPLVPIGILVPLMYFILVRKIFYDYTLAIVFALYMLMEVAQSAYWDTFAYAWARILYLLIIFFIVDGWQRRKNIGASLIILIAFISCQFIHYTEPLWIIIFLVTVYFLQVAEKNSQNKIGSNLILFCVVIYLTFNKIFYDTFVPSLIQILEKGYYDPMMDFWLRIKARVLGYGITGGGYAYHPSVGIYGTTRLLLNLFFFGSLLLTLPLILKKGLRVIRNKKVDFNWRFYMYCGFLVVVFMQAIGYGIVGVSISAQFLLFMGPIIVVLALSQDEKNLQSNHGQSSVRTDRRIHKIKAGQSTLTKLRSIFLISLILLSVTSFILSFTIEPTTKSPSLVKSSVLEPSTKWLLGGAENNSIVLAGFDVRYYYKFKSIEYDKKINMLGFTSEIYDYLISGDIKSERRWDYIVLTEWDYESRVIGNKLSNLLVPISLHNSEIACNARISKIYDDGNVYVFT